MAATADPRQGSSCYLDARLRSWIDQSELNQNIRSTEHEHHGIATTLYQTCVDLYRGIWNCYRRDGKKSGKFRDQIRDNLSQLLLWGDTIENGRLDACLGYSDDLKECVLDILSHITETLIRGVYQLEPVRSCPINDDIRAPLREALSLLEKIRTILGDGDTSAASDTESDGSSNPGGVVIEKNFVKDIAAHLTCLMDLVPTIEQTGQQRDLAGRVVVGSLPSASFRMSAPAEQYVRQICDKYPKAPNELAERLGEANWQRFQRIRDSEQEKSETATDTKGALELAKSAFAPVSQFHDSGLGSSIPALSQYAASDASYISYLSSEVDKDSGRLRVPSIPKEAVDGLPFGCFICGKTLATIRNRLDWKLHVFHDLQPYICCARVGECRDSLVTFPTRKLWADHECSQHHIFNFWDCNDCLKEFASEQSYVEHLQLDHHVSSAGQLIQSLLTSAKRSMPKPVEDQECPLCLKTGWKDRRLFTRHLGGHMEEIALSSLPREVDSEAEDGDGSEVSESLDNSLDRVDAESDARNLESTRRMGSGPQNNKLAGSTRSISPMNTPTCPFCGFNCSKISPDTIGWREHLHSHFRGRALPLVACFYICDQRFHDERSWERMLAHATTDHLEETRNGKTTKADLSLVNGMHSQRIFSDKRPIPHGLSALADVADWISGKHGDQTSRGAFQEHYEDPAATFLQTAVADVEVERQDPSLSGNDSAIIQLKHSKRPGSIVPAPSVQQIRQHPATADQSKNCPVPVCEYPYERFNRKRDRDRHLAKHYRGTMACGFCPESELESNPSFNRIDDFKEHLRSVHNVIELSESDSVADPNDEATMRCKFMCSICELDFRSVQAFYDHLDICFAEAVEQGLTMQNARPSRVE